MKQRPALTFFLMVSLVVGFVMGAIGVGAAGTGIAVEPAHMSDHAAGPGAEPGSDCPAAGSAMQKGHEACEVTICCFSEGSALAVETPDFVLMPARTALSVEPRLTQAEPERAKKPPRLT